MAKPLTKTLLELKAWANSGPSDDVHRVTLDGSCLHLTKGGIEEGEILSTLDFSDPPIEQTPPPSGPLQDKAQKDKK